MAETRYRLTRALRLNGKRFLPGQEAELSRQLTKEQASDLVRRGVIEAVQNEGAPINPTADKPSTDAR